MGRTGPRGGSLRCNRVEHLLHRELGGLDLGPPLVPHHRGNQVLGHWPQRIVAFLFGGVGRTRRRGFQWRPEAPGFEPLCCAAPAEAPFARVAALCFLQSSSSRKLCSWLGVREIPRRSRPRATCRQASCKVQPWKNRTDTATASRTFGAVPLALDWHRRDLPLSARTAGRARDRSTGGGRAPRSDA